MAINAEVEIRFEHVCLNCDIENHGWIIDQTLYRGIQEKTKSTHHVPDWRISQSQTPG